MARPLDPWRTLELTREATLDDVKAAYRRLAKRFHPDSAGEAALGRFLAVQAAYEALTEGPDRLRLAPPSRARRPAAQRPGAQRPAAQRPRRSTGAARPGDGGSRRSDRGAAPKRAKPGSTSYDDAQFEPFEPSWEGATWYGESSGTYWTINPREFADPRKHGPEYQARARREAAGHDDVDGAADGSPESPWRVAGWGDLSERGGSGDLGAPAGVRGPTGASRSTADLVSIGLAGVGSSTLALLLIGGPAVGASGPVVALGGIATIVAALVVRGVAGGRRAHR
jgi:curved DNA-binding protein CbpA